MIEDKLLPSQLKTFDYYVNKLPMYLQQSEGFITHFRLWYDLLVGKPLNEVNTFGVVGFGNILFNLLNIFDQDISSDGSIRNKYLEDLVKIGDVGTIDENNEYGTQSDILDKLGALFGVKRVFEVKYRYAEVDEIHRLSLNNEEFLMLIKAQIIKNYCDGTYIQLKEYYESIGLYVYLVIPVAPEPATCNVYLAYSNNSIYVVSENVQRMFLAGLLTIESMGITYRYAIVNVEGMLIWDNSQNGWAETDTLESVARGGQWVI